MKNLLLSFAAFTARLLPVPVKRRLYSIPPLARLLRGTLNRAAPRGMVTETVASGGLAGAKLLLDLHTEKDYWLGTYESELQQAVEKYVSTGATIYDVGANIGYISLLLARKTGSAGRVYAFEALPENQERLRANIRLNDFGSRISVVPAAVIESSRPVRFLVGPSGGMGKAEGSAGRQEIKYNFAIDVSGISLDDFVFGSCNPEPQVVKMDIEGGEVLALTGMRRLLAEVRPLVLIELHGHEAAQAAWEAFTAANYTIHEMVKGYPQIHTLEALGWKAYLLAMPQPIVTEQGSKRTNNSKAAQENLQPEIKESS